MLHIMLARVIRETFLKEAGKFQGSKPEPKAMLLTFAFPCRKSEDGYRNRQLLLYAQMNYVAVFEREQYDVIAEDDLVYDEETDETRIKEGCNYTKGATEWVLRAHHDSCWFDAIESFFRDHRGDINGFSGGSSWFKIVNPNEYKLPDGF